MTVLARDAVASDHLVYAWPFPIGPECEIACAADEEVVMCPAWTVGDRLGPGHHVWRTPSPMHPVTAFFVRTSPVDAIFDLTTSFLIPATGQGVRIRAAGTLQVRCADPGLLIAQFVGLPFDHVNDGILRSVSRSIERMLARLLTRRVVMGASPIAVTDPGMLPGIIEELVAYNPTAGAVFGVDLICMNQLVIAADDGSMPYVVLPPVDWGSQPGMHAHNGELARASQPDIPLTETARGRPLPEATPPPLPAPPQQTTASGEITPRKKPSPPGAVVASSQTASTSGEILVRPKGQLPTPPPIPALGTSPPGAPANRAPVNTPAGAVADATRPTDDITQPGMRSPLPPIPSIRTTSPGLGAHAAGGAILGIGMGAIGGEIPAKIPSKVAPGSRVLVPGPNGLMQSATVKQLLQGYYELEVGSTGDTIWVPVTGVVPE